MPSLFPVLAGPAPLVASGYGPDLPCAGDRMPGAAAYADDEARLNAMNEGSTVPSYAFLKYDDLRRLASYLVEHTCAEEAAA